MVETKTGNQIIFIGNKPFMNYVTGVVMQFTTKNMDEVNARRNKHVGDKEVFGCGF